MDLGLEALNIVREQLGVDDEWCVEDERGFTWWADDLAQSVWAERAFDDEGITIWRLHARTDLVRGCKRRPHGLELLARLNSMGALSGLTFRSDQPDTVQLAASVFLHEDSFGWVVPLFQIASGFQLADAYAMAPQLAETLGAERAITEHPESGRRPEPDEMLGLVEALPLRDGGSRFRGEEMVQGAKFLQAGPSVLATSSPGDLTAEFPFGSETSLLHADTEETHPRYGSGLQLILTLPRTANDGALEGQAVQLGALELSQFTRTHCLGGWCLSPDDPPLLAFHAFYPNVAFRPGVLTNLLLSMAARAHWLEHEIIGSARSALSETAKSPTPAEGFESPGERQWRGPPPPELTISGVPTSPVKREPTMPVLSKELFERGEPYGQAAIDLVEEAGAGRLPPIPQAAKDWSLGLMTRLADPKIVRKYSDSLAEALVVSYRLTTAETWEDLDREQARVLIDDGLARVRQQHLDTGVPDPLELANPEARMQYSVLGLTGTHRAFEHVRQYLLSRSACERLGTLDDLHLRIGLAAGGVRGRHADAFMRAQTIAWQIGRALGILDVLGEVPTAEPNVDNGPVVSQLETGRPDYQLDEEGDLGVLLGEAVARFNARIASGESLADEDIELALLSRAGILFGLDDGSMADKSDPTVNTLIVTGRAGYVWRRVENDPEKAGFGFVRDEVHAVYSSIALHGADRFSTLAIAAEKLLIEGVSIEFESPGGLLGGRDFLESGYEYVVGDVLGVGAADEVRQLLRAMFYYGVALRDIEKLAGPAPAQVAAEREESQEGERLGAELFRRDVDAYVQLAGWIVSDKLQRPALTETLADVLLRVFYPLLAYFDDQPIDKIQVTPFGAAIGHFYREVASGTYAVASLEEWEGLDVGVVAELVDSCVADGGGAGEDEFAQAVWIVRGVSGDLDRFHPVAEFVRSQPAYERLSAFADAFLVRPDEKLAAFLRADESKREKVETAASLGWNAGVTLALLEKIGRVPTARED